MAQSPQLQPKTNTENNNSQHGVFPNQQNVFLDVVDAFQNYIGNKLSMLEVA